MAIRMPLYSNSNQRIPPYCRRAASSGVGDAGHMEYTVNMHVGASQGNQRDVVTVRPRESNPVYAGGHWAG